MDDMTDKCVCTENLSGPATVAGCDCGCDGDVASGKPKGRSLFGKGVSCIVCVLVFVPCVIFALLLMYGRAPFPVHVKVPTQRTFDFYFAEGGSFASLSIKLAYDRFNRNTLEEKVKKHEAIFRQVFSELKTASGKTIIRGQSYYDAASGTGIIRNLVRVKDERGRGR